MASSKQQQILDWVNNNISVTFSTVQLAQDLKISLPTILSFIKAHPHRFSKFKHGYYIVNADDAATIIDQPSIAATNTSIVPVVPIESTHPVFLPPVTAEEYTETQRSERPFEW